MKTTILALLILPLAQATASDPFGMPAQSLPHQEFEQTGDLVKVKFIPGGKDKEVRLYVVGKDPATMFKPDEVEIIGTTTVGGQPKVVKFHRKNDYYTTDEEIAVELHLKLRSTRQKRVDEFHFRLKNP